VHSKIGQILGIIVGMTGGIQGIHDLMTQTTNQGSRCGSRCGGSRQFLQIGGMHQERADTFGMVLLGSIIVDGIRDLVGPSSDQSTGGIASFGTGQFLQVLCMNEETANTFRVVFFGGIVMNGICHLIGPSANQTTGSSGRGGSWGLGQFLHIIGIYQESTNAGRTGLERHGLILFLLVVVERKRELSM